MTSNDKDFRFMATNDLMTELQKDSIKLDDDSERKVRQLIYAVSKFPSYKAPHSAVKKWPYKTGLERENLVLFTISVHLKSGLIKSVGIWWEWPYKTGTTVYMLLNN